MKEATCKLYFYQMLLAVKVHNYKLYQEKYGYAYDCQMNFSVICHFWNLCKQAAQRSWQVGLRRFFTSVQPKNIQTLLLINNRTKVIIQAMLIDDEIIMCDF